MANFLNSKLIKLLKTLDESDFKSLDKWLKSPWCNSNKKLITFHKTMHPFFPELSSERLNKEYVFKKLFPGNNYNPAKLNNLIRKYVSQIEKFFIHQLINKDDQQQGFLFKEACQKRGLDDLFFDQSNKLISDLEQNKINNASSYLQLSALYEGLYYHPGQSVKYQSTANHLDKAVFYLDSFYAISKYRFLHESKTRKAIVKGTKDDHSVLHLLNHLRQKIDIPELELYHQRMEKSADWDIRQLEAFFDLYQKWRPRLPYREQQIFLYACLNDTVALVAQGEDRAHQKMLDIYKLGLKEKLILINGQLNKATYNNIVLIANILNDFSFADQFINNYTDNLPSNVRQQALSWARGQTFYSKGDFNKALNILDNEKFEDDIYAIQARVTQLKANYDLYRSDNTYYDYFQSYCDTFEKYVQRHKIFTTERKQAYLRLIQHSRKIARIQDNKSPEKKDQLKKINDKIKKEKHLFGRRWLKKKIEEIK